MNMENAQSSTSRWGFIRGDIADKPLIDDIVEGIIRVMGGAPEKQNGPTASRFRHTPSTT